MKSLRARLKIHRRAVLIGIGCMILVALVAYGLWSMITWSNYVSSYEDWKNNAQKAVDQAVALPSTTAQERSRKVDALKKLAQQVGDRACDVHVLVKWQDTFGNLKQKEADCQREAALSRDFISRVESFTAYLTNEQQLAGILSDAAGTEQKLADAVWGTRLEAWQKAVRQVEGMSASGSFQKVKQEALQTGKGITSAWQDVLAAHKEKDKIKYTQAQSQLSQAYAQLEVLKTMDSDQLSQEINNLQAAYKAAFQP